MRTITDAHMDVYNHNDFLIELWDGTETDDKYPKYRVWSSSIHAAYRIAQSVNTLVHGGITEQVEPESYNTNEHVNVRLRRCWREKFNHVIHKEIEQTTKYELLWENGLFTWKGRDFFINNGLDTVSEIV